MTHASCRGHLVLSILCGVLPVSVTAQDRVAGANPASPPAHQPSAPVEIVTLSKPLPLPGQLKPVSQTAAAPRHGVPEERVVTANAAARMQPVRDGFINAMQLYPWTEGALYQVYAAPGHVTDIALQTGETLAGAGPVAAGDTARWIIGDTVSGAGDNRRVHILAKPVRQNLVTNLVINTDRRTYHIELRATPFTYMASVAWSYPQDQLVALRQRNEEIAARMPVATDVNVAALNFAYEVEGDKPGWRPIRAFDDGRQTYIEFPADIVQNEMPPIFILGASGSTELVNYRVKDRFMVLDRLFTVAELRLGDTKTETRVRILRSTGRRTSRR